MSTIGQILIGKSVAYGLLGYGANAGSTIASYNDVYNLADGAMAIFNDDGHFVDAAADLLDSKFITIAVGGSTNKKARISKKIYRDGLRISGRAYSAPTNLTMYLGYNETGTNDLNIPTMTAGLILSVVVEQKTEVNLVLRKRTVYEYVTTASDTKATAIAALVAIINADADRLVDATYVVSGSYAGIKFVAINNEQLKIYGQQDLINAPRKVAPDTNCVAYFSGVGTSAQVLEREKAYMLNEGQGNYLALYNEMFTYATQTVDGATYEQIVLNWNPVGSYPAGSFEAVPQYLVLAIVTGASQLTTIKALLDDVAATGVAASSSESGISEENETIVS